MWHVLLFWLCLVDSANGGVIKSSLDDCSKHCRRAYTLHPIDGRDACKEGCQMYKGISVTSNQNRSTLKTSCIKACAQKYTDKASQESCNDGCKHQVPFGQGKSDHLEMIVTNPKDPMYSYAHSMAEKMFDRMESMGDHMMHMRNHMMQSLPDFGSWFGSGSRLDDHLDEMQKDMMKQVNSVLNAEKLIHEKNSEGNDGNDGESHDSSSTHAYSGVKNQHYGKTVDNMNSNGGKLIRVHIIPSDHSKGGIIKITGPSDGHEFPMSESSRETSEKAKGVSRVNDPADSWMAYIAHRTGRLSTVTKWLLFLAMTLCLMSMIWICLAIMKTSHMHVFAFSPSRLGVFGWGNGAKAGTSPPTGVSVVEGTTSDKASLVKCEEVPGEAGNLAPPPYTPK